MKREMLEKRLSSIGVLPVSFSLDGLRNNDCLCVVEEHMLWKVYYVERDQPKELSVFQSCDEAYDYVYEKFSKWLGN